MIEAVMPKGVEHEDMVGRAVAKALVIEAVMPKGVEHAFNTWIESESPA